LSKDSSLKIVEEYERVFSKGIRTNYAPIVAYRTKGSYVWDINGKKYVDLSSSAAVMNVGYCHDRIVKVIKECCERLIHFTFIYGFNLECLELARKLIDIAPLEDKDNLKVYLGLSGSDANEAALVFAKSFSRKRYIIAFSDSFHGLTLGSNSVSGVELSRYIYNHVGGLGNVIFVPYPDCYRPKVSIDGMSCSEAHYEVLKSIIESLPDPNNIAALIAEPIQGDGGIIVPPHDYFPKVKNLLSKYDILFIDDEVQTCLGRTGYWFAIEAFNTKPDLVVLGKPLGGGLPISANIGPKEILDSVPPAACSFTLSGNPLICKVASEVIDIIKEEKLVERARYLGNKVLSKLKSWVKKYNIVGDVRGMGLMIGVDIVRDKEKRTRGYDEAKKIVWRAYELGLIINFVHGNVLRIQPPLNIEEEALQEALNTLEQAIEDVEKGKVGDEALKYVTGW